SAGAGVGLGNYVSQAFSLADVKKEFPNAEVYIVADAFEKTPDGKVRVGGAPHLSRGALFRNIEGVHLIESGEAQDWFEAVGRYSALIESFEKEVKAGNASGISAIEKEMAELEEKAGFDLITGLGSSRELMERLELIQRFRRKTLIGVDLKGSTWNLNPLQVLGHVYDFRRTAPILNSNAEPDFSMPARTVQAISSLGISQNQEQPVLDTSKGWSAEKESAKKILKDLGFNVTAKARVRRLILLDAYVGSRRGIKDWSEKEFVRYLEDLNGQLGEMGIEADVLMTQYGDGTEYSYRARRIAEVFKKSVDPSDSNIRLTVLDPEVTNDTGIYMGIMHYVDSVVTLETGASHLAAAMKKDHILIYNTPAEWAIFTPPNDRTFL
ncbi:MAG TPA: hypothetical protein VJC03_07325, partial [bacterium]|nr:hypothetical protein [bacterium]